MLEIEDEDVGGVYSSTSNRSLGGEAYGCGSIGLHDDFVNFH